MSIPIDDWAADTLRCKYGANNNGLLRARTAGQNARVSGARQRPRRHRAMDQVVLDLRV